MVDFPGVATQPGDLPQHPASTASRTASRATARAGRQPRAAIGLTMLSAALLLAACGGEMPQVTEPAAVEATATSTTATEQPAATYRLGGTVSGLAAGLTLQLQQASETLTIEANGPFEFATPLAEGAGYAVSVTGQPMWQHCSVASGTGVAAADLGQIAVSCGAAVAEVTTFAGTAGAGTGTQDGTGPAARFMGPSGTAVDRAGNVYVADRDANMIRKITPDGVVTTLAGNLIGGYTDGPGADARFDSPYGVAVDSAGTVYVADTFNHRIRKITPAGDVSTLAGSGATGISDGPASSASFNLPIALTLDQDDQLYVADYGSGRIRKVTSAGDVTTIANIASSLLDLAVAADGAVYFIIEDDQQLYRRAVNGDITVFAGSTNIGANDGTGTAASFAYPRGLGIDPSGALILTESGGNRIRRITSDAVVTTLAGTSGAGSLDGRGTAASFNVPADAAVDSQGNIYIPDLYNALIRKLTPVAP